jgi:hypothetical protein
MADLIYIKNASGGGGGGDATAANQTTQIGIENNILTQTTAINTKTADVVSNTAQIASNTGLRPVAVNIASITTNTVIAAGFSSYTFVNQGTQPATINTFLNLPVGSSFTVNFERNEFANSTFTIAFAALPGANVCVITNN